MRLAAFEGDWTVERIIEDVRSGRTGRLDGSVRFAPDAAGLVCEERGLLALGDAAPVAAYRRYLWRDAGANAIEVRFEDGRFFHRFYADEDRPAAIHDCPPDQYRVRYDFARWPCWTAEWRVRGPRKDYAMVTTYRPAARP
jgi:hypothetical protein